MNKNLEKKFISAIHECYCELFAKSDPPGDFNKMLEEADINERGQKVIPYLDYVIDHEELESIVEKTFKKYKFNQRYFSSFRNEILLGCSPKSNYKDKNKQ